MQALASLLRTLKPSRGDAAATSIGLATPFLMAADAAGHAPSLLEIAIAAAATAAAGLLVKSLIVGAGAGLRFIQRRFASDRDESNDLAGGVAGAIADAVDPEHADKHTKDKP